MRPSTARRTTASVVLSCAAAVLVYAALVGAGPAQAAGCRGADMAPTGDNGAALRKATLCLVNHERHTRDLAAVRTDPKLTRAARRYAKRMVDEQFYSHVAPDGETFVARIKATGYLRPARQWLVGENLMWGTDELATPRAVVKAWMRSPKHRRNVLNKRFRQIGIGSVFGAPEETADGTVAATYATEYGYRKLR